MPRARRVIRRTGSNDGGRHLDLPLAGNIEDRERPEKPATIDPDLSMRSLASHHY